MKLGNFNLVSETQNFSSHLNFSSPQKQILLLQIRKSSSSTSFYNKILLKLIQIRYCSSTTLLKVFKKRKISIIYTHERDQSWFLRCKMGIIIFVIPAVLKLPDEKSPQHDLPLRASLVILCLQMLCLMDPTWTQSSIPRVPAWAPHRPHQHRAVQTPHSWVQLLITTSAPWQVPFGWSLPTAACITLIPGKSNPSNTKNWTLSDLPPGIILPLQLGCASIFNSNKVHLPVSQSLEKTLHLT